MLNTMRALLEEVSGECLAICPAWLDRMAAAEAGDTAQESAQAELRHGSDTIVRGRVAIIPIRGVILHRSDLFGASTLRIGDQIDAAIEDSRVDAIVLDIQSPGGVVDGVQELADKISGAREIKSITAVANNFAFSAAYWIAAAAGRIVVPESGDLGSIGVIWVHFEESRALDREGVTVNIVQSVPFKKEANPFEPLTDEARKFQQERVDEIHETFANSVASNRGVDRSVVDENFGKGRIFGAHEALRRHMADEIGTLADVITGLAAGAESRGARATGDSRVALLRRKTILRDRQLSA